MRQHSGLSLWALLLSIAVIGTHVGLLLPASQSAREYHKSNGSYSSGDLINNAYVQSESRIKTASPGANATFESMGSSDKAISPAQNLESADLSRRIIYEADLTVVVKGVEEAETKLLTLLEESGGYIAEATVHGAPGQHLSGHWRVRVPAGRFSDFVDNVSLLGIAENRRQTAQDVTEEFVDLESQVDSKQQLEQRILELLDKSTGTIAEVIVVERELGRVRSEIERMEGRLNFLSNRTASQPFPSHCVKSKSSNPKLSQRSHRVSAKLGTYPCSLWDNSASDSSWQQSPPFRGSAWQA